MNRCHKPLFIDWSAWLLLALLLANPAARAAGDDFTRGQQTYERQDFPAAAQSFATAVSNAPSAGAYQNLGNAEWLNGRVAEALLAWERALWVYPRAAGARNNLQFAREVAQLEAPDLT